MPKKKELIIAALADSKSQPGSYALVLEDAETRYRIPVIIGAFEAQAIAIAMEHMQPARPLTHDLMQHLLEGLGARLQEVLIHSLIDGIFHAQLSLLKADGELLLISARTSDAVALAIRCGAPIYAYETVIEEAGLLADIWQTVQKKGSFSEYSLEDLESLLQKLIDKEDYESAVRIRNIIDARKPPAPDEASPQ